MSAVQTTPAVDAFTAEVIRNAVVAITSEMKTNLMRTAYSSIIYEAEDFTVGLFDADGHTISIGLGLPMFIRWPLRRNQGENCPLRQGKYCPWRHLAYQRWLRHG